MEGKIPLYGAVEGQIDEIVLRRLLLGSNFKIENIFGKKGKEYLRSKILGYNNAARRCCWLVLLDLNSEAECAPVLIQTWVLTPSDKLIFRVAVREIETWLLADKERIASYFRFSASKIPDNLEVINDPKRTLVDLLRTSRSSAIRKDMVPREGSGREVGEAYTSRLIEFVTDLKNGWRPDIAAKNSNSLERCLNKISEG